MCEQSDVLGVASEVQLYDRVCELLEHARSHVQSSVNIAMVSTYYEIGRMIIEEEQQGSDRATYGARILEGLSARLTERFGRGFSVENLKLMRRFYRVYSTDQDRVKLFTEFGLAIGQTSFTESFPVHTFPLSWSHYLMLMRIRDVNERHFYEIEAIREHWSLKELSRQKNSALYERLALSRDMHKVRELAEKGQVVQTPTDAIKDPYILEFLGLKEDAGYSERELESRIIDHLQEFLLELGRGFTFVGRQVRFTFEEDHFRVDLVFYNRLLRCFVLFDLKLEKLTHQDLGQMQMYVHYYDRYEKLPDENPTIGILLCKEKNDAVVELTLPEDNEQIFASRYETVLPSKEALRRLLEEASDE